MNKPTDNVIPFRSSKQQQRSPMDPDTVGIDMERYPVDIRGNVTFGRLMSGLATVGLTVRVDSRSGCVVITDDSWE
jgi:hypothetical protein